MLRYSLADHPNIQMKGEVCREGGIEDVRRLYRPYPSYVQAVGFKLFYYHNKKSKSVWEYFFDLDSLRVVHLQRHNRLRTYVSLLRARESGRWVRQKKDNVQEKQPVHVDVEKWHEHMAYMDRRRREAMRYVQHCKMHEVSYTDLVDDWEGSLHRIQDFLGVPKVSLPVKTARQNPEPLQQLIANYDEVAAKLEGTPEEQYLVGL